MSNGDERHRRVFNVGPRDIGTHAATELTHPNHGLRAVGFLGRKTEFPRQIRARFRHMADFSIDRHFLIFLALTTAR